MTIKKIRWLSHFEHLKNLSFDVTKLGKPKLKILIFTNILLCIKNLYEQGHLPIYYIYIYIYIYVCMRNLRN